MEKESRLRSEQKVIMISAVSAIIIIILGLLTGDTAVIGNLFILAIAIIVVPFFLVKYSHTLWVKNIETQFPNFIRDLADSKRSGMSFPEAISISSKGNYGKLTPEIIKMHNRLSWGTPFLRVMEIFRERVKDSKIITESLTIIAESYRAGGNISRTLDSVARDILMLKEVEADRLSLVKQHVFIMYGIFYMFLGISIMIIFVMVPLIATQPEFGATGALSIQFVNPCPPESTIIFPCGFFSLIGALFDISPAAAEGLTSYYIALFFSVVMINGLFTGLIAGQIGEGSVIAGSKHALIMLFSALGIFLFLAKIGFFPT